MKFIQFGFIISLIAVFITVLSSHSFGQSSDSNIASDILNNKTLTVPNSVKNFVILIPNEAHESPELPKDQRLINQHMSRKT